MSTKSKMIRLFHNEEVLKPKKQIDTACVSTHFSLSFVVLVHSAGCYQRDNLGKNKVPFIVHSLHTWQGVQSPYFFPFIAPLSPQLNTSR
jgi:hypothetical protein